MLRSVVPQVAHAGFASIAVMVPKAALPNVVLGSANCGWLRMLKASTRSSRSILPNLVILMSDDVDVELARARARCCGRCCRRCR